MFSASIFVVEADLHDKPATDTSISSNNNNNNNNNENSSNSSSNSNNSNNRKDPISGADTATDTKGNQSNEAPVKTNSFHSFLFNPIPKPEPVPEPPTSETVDDALGPKPEPIPRPPTPTPDPYLPSAPISWKVLWASLSAPTNPSV